MAGDSWQASGSCGGSYYGEGYHTGAFLFALDFNRYPACASDPGYPILVVRDGVVIFSGWRSGFGNCVEVDHGFYQGRRSTSFYAHFKDGAPILVSTGETVRQGQVLGLCGMSGGTSTGEHLHFEQRENGNSVEVTSMDGYRFCNSLNCRGHVQISLNDAVFDRAESEYYSYTRNLGGRNGNPRWWYTWQAGQTNNCYVQPYWGPPRGSWRGAVVYDALHGAQKAIPVVKGFWDWWRTNGDGNDGNGNDGPRSDPGMPLGPEYAYSTGSRQDFQNGFLLWRPGFDITFSAYPYGYGPGKFADGWHNNHSYKFADCYERNGKRNSMGEPHNQVWHAGGGRYRQDFVLGSYGNCQIEFDTNASQYANLIRNLVQPDGRKPQPLSACLLRSGFRDYWLSHGQYAGLGAPINNEVPTAFGQLYTSVQWFVAWNGSRWVGTELRWYPGVGVRTYPLNLPSQKTADQPDTNRIESDPRLPTVQLTVLANPAHQNVEFSFTAPANSAASLRIFNVQGRLVREFAPDHFMSGSTSLTWDGKDSEGRVVPAGLYLAVLRAGNQAVKTKILLLH